MPGLNIILPWLCIILFRLIAKMQDYRLLSIYWFLSYFLSRSRSYIVLSSNIIARSTWRHRYICRFTLLMSWWSLIYRYDLSWLAHLSHRGVSLLVTREFSWRVVFVMRCTIVTRLMADHTRLVADHTRLAYWLMILTHDARLMAYHCRVVLRFYIVVLLAISLWSLLLYLHYLVCLFPYLNIF